MDRGQADTTMSERREGRGKGGSSYGNAGCTHCEKREETSNFLVPKLVGALLYVAEILDLC